MKNSMLMFNIKKQIVLKNVPEIGLGLLIALAVILNITWIQTDNQLGPDSDSKEYFISTLVFMDGLRADGLNNLLPRIQGLSLGGRPPLYQLLSIPFILGLGRSMDSGLILNLLFQVLLLLFVYKFGKIVSGPPAGLLAAFLISIYPPLVQLSRIFRPHYAISACVVFSLWLLLHLSSTRTVKNAWYFILSFGFGCFIHPGFLTTLIIPAAIISVYILFFQTQPQKPVNFKDFLGWLSCLWHDAPGWS